MRSLSKPLSMTTGMTNLGRTWDWISDAMWTNKWMPYRSSRSTVLTSVAVLRTEVGEGVRGSRDSRFNLLSSS